MKAYITEIFKGIDGEVNGFGQGLLTTFVRFGGCNLNCAFCDTKYSLSTDDKVKMPLSDISAQILRIGTHKITFTGGEPLVQKDALYELISDFTLSTQISVETNGSIEIDFDLFPEVSWVIDYKLDHADKMIPSNFIMANKRDWVKFVITKPQDLERAGLVLGQLYKEGMRTNVAFSPIFVDGQPQGVQNIVDWIQDFPAYLCPELNIGLNIQLHKLLNFK